MLTSNPETTLVVFALDVEARSRFDTFSPLYTGVGKINATYSLTRRIAEWRTESKEPPQCVLNLGSAGSSTFATGTVVNCTGFVQRDFDATAVGCEPFATPFDLVPAFLNSGIRFTDFPEGVCGTGDNFMTSGEVTPSWNVVDMEAYALAKTCFIEKIPFACLKYITDGADGHAAATWESMLEEASYALHASLKKIFPIHTTLHTGALV